MDELKKEGLERSQAIFLLVRAGCVSTQPIGAGCLDFQREIWVERGGCGGNKALQGSFGPKKAFFKHQIGLQTNKHLHEQLSKS